ncbi:hypothetical protein RBSH_03768 [Rhodopirellula baltica SH28]|uniref:Uncharacterized protein n=1 Tax=Rhodopirellula baltica SH28 TaxID=993517 RepID=K5DDK6_RHOBT|nr:hypothetical protein RBSH_03768 [Rhodopirellula baltica SH28]
MLVCALLFAVWLAALYPFLAAMQERNRVQDEVFMPFADLQADFLHNGFGVFILEFHKHSLLSDTNANELLLLNQMPPKYELTLVIDTNAITDASIDTFANLTTVDYLIVGDTVLSAEGFANLEQQLPTETHFKIPTKNGG